MKINSSLLRELSSQNKSLEEIECISFFTIWDLMVFPGWKAYLPLGDKFSLSTFKHRNLVKEDSAIEKIVEVIIS